MRPHNVLRLCCLISLDAILFPGVVFGQTAPPAPAFSPDLPPGAKVISVLPTGEVRTDYVPDQTNDSIASAPMEAGNGPVTTGSSAADNFLNDYRHSCDWVSQLAFYFRAPGHSRPIHSTPTGTHRTGIQQPKPSTAGIGVAEHRRVGAPTR